MQGLEAFCAQVRPDDGIPPQNLKKKSQSKGQRAAGRHRFQQYCKAARQALENALAIDCGDEALKTASISAVEHQGGGASLLVVISAPIHDIADITAMESRLKRASGLLRSALASELRRKRVPHLQFRIVPESE